MCIHMNVHSERTTRLLEGATCLRALLLMPTAEEQGWSTALSVVLMIEVFCYLQQVSLDRAGSHRLRKKHVLTPRLTWTHCEPP